MKKLLLCVFLAFLMMLELNARPQYSILQTYGTKCSNCHVNNNYGGQRNSGGFMARNSISVIKPEDIGLSGLYDFLSDKNEFMDGKVIWGLDFRYQNARWGQTQKLQGTRDSNLVPVMPSLERKGMIMQLMPYLSIQPFEWMRIDGMYNFSYDIEPNMRYKGQQPGYVNATFDLFEDLPTITLGYITPKISVDYDDHTYLVRQAAGKGRSTPLFPADYAELGLELNYDRLDWLNASFGLFDSKNMSELTIDNTIPVVEKSNMATVLNVSVHPSLSDGFVGFAGLSHYWNGKIGTDDGIYFANNYFTISSIYLGFGMSDKFALMAEYSTSKKQDIRNVDNFLVELNYQIYEPVNVFARYEIANTEMKQTGEKFEANQYVFGSHIYLLPYIDLLPEYRIYDRGEVNGYSSQWAFQIHVFY